MKTPSDNERRKLHRPEAPARMRLLLRALLSLLTGLGLTLCLQLIAGQSLHQTLAFLWESPFALLAQGLFLALPVFFLASLTYSLLIGGAVVSVLALALGLINYYKTLITSTPLLLADFALVGKLGEITALNSTSITVSRNTAIAVIACAVWLAVLWWLSRCARPEGRKGSLIAAGAAAVIFLLAFAVQPVANFWCFRPLNAGLTAPVTQATVSQRCGVPLGLWRAVLVSGDAFKVDEDDREDILSEADATLQAQEEDLPVREKPNVIMVLSESFFDVTELPGVQYAEDPVSDFHAACAEGVSGTFYTRTLGYGTSNIELELLTGINTRFFARDDSLIYWEPSAFEKLLTVPHAFAEQGYYTAFLHTFDDSIYNRTPIYERLGFDDLYFSGDFAAVDPEAAAAEDYWAYMGQRISGDFYSDAYMAELIIDLYEREEEDGPVFLYAATMENHTPFAADKYDNYEFPFTSGLSEEGVGVLNAFTQGAANASKMLGTLIDYFSAQEEPTVIVYFGDHRPGLPLESGGTVYSALGMCPEDQADWSVEETAELYSTDYVIWANDPAYLPGEAGQTQDTSCTFLGLRTMQCAGLPLDAYWRMLEDISGVFTAYTWNYWLSAEGELSAAPEALDTDKERRLNVMTWLVREPAASTGTPAFYTLE